MYVGIPNPNALIPLAKMVIVNLDTEEEITVLYNPQSYVQHKEVKYTDTDDDAPVGSDGPIVQFSHGGKETLQFELFLDSLYAGAEVGGMLNKLKFGANSILPSFGSLIDIRDYTKKIYNLTKIEKTAHRPPRLLVMWASLQFVGYLADCQQQFTKFNEFGKPVRATLKCTFVQCIDMDKAGGLNPFESPDTTKYHRVQEGDSLWSLAVEEYGQADAWRAIADANGIYNPRLLHTGDMLRIPALKH